MRGFLIGLLAAILGTVVGHALIVAGYLTVLGGDTPEWGWAALWGATVAGIACGLIAIWGASRRPAEKPLAAHRA